MPQSKNSAKASANPEKILCFIRTKCEKLIENLKESSQHPTKCVNISNLIKIITDSLGELSQITTPENKILIQKQLVKMAVRIEMACHLNSPLDGHPRLIKKTNDLTSDLRSVQIGQTTS